MAKFKGFSTINKVRPSYTLTDDELVKRDLLNEFYTKKGERVMRPNFGSIIWDLLMDPATDTIQQEIEEDVKRITSRDPRVNLINTQIYVLDHAIRVDIDLAFLSTGNEDSLYLTFIRDMAESI